jgi:hypothetical protein
MPPSLQFVTHRFMTIAIFLLAIIMILFGGDAPWNFMEHAR